MTRAGAAKSDSRGLIMKAAVYYKNEMAGQIGGAGRIELSRPFISGVLVRDKYDG
jgi:hypothetical protein